MIPKFKVIKDVSVCYCSCKPLSEALILMGMFPASPTDPKNAIHLGLLGCFNEVRNTLKSSSEDIVVSNNFRTVFNMFNKLLLLTEEVVNERSLMKDQAMCCSACPSRDSIHPMDRIFITMDGCFSMKCKSKASPLDRLNLANTVKNAWVKPECVELYKNEKAPKDALINENTFKATCNGASYKSKLYPVKGIFTATCARHELTLKMVDMDSGEGFKYPLSVLHELFEEDKDSIKTPINLMYDIICILEKSLTTKFPYLTGNAVSPALIPKTFVEDIIDILINPTCSHPTVEACTQGTTLWRQDTVKPTQSLKRIQLRHCEFDEDYLGQLSSRLPSMLQFATFIGCSFGDSLMWSTDLDTDDKETVFIKVTKNKATSVFYKVSTNKLLAVSSFLEFETSKDDYMAHTIDIKKLAIKTPFMQFLLTDEPPIICDDKSYMNSPDFSLFYSDLYC
ncbi:hypothetical protein INT47_002541 [Mucor saturninus]|uniref:Uncharacterized protein n=1 Tax=Mucor saturninus TaxID=64648 RepID=A0A8H7RFR0_9FUNG|nr:hypothetical protein INT47_002541 [Mucor saturninus]